MTAGAKIVHSGGGGGTGPQGPQGPQGATGATGPQGPQGALANNLTNVNLADQTSNPTTPVTSTNIFAKTLVGRGLAQQQNEIGLPSFIGSALWSKQFVMVTPGTVATAANANPNFFGSGLAVTSTASTVTAATASYGVYSELQSAASSSTNALVRTSTFWTNQSTPTNYFQGLFFYARFYLPDANYTAATSTQSSLFCGLGSNISTELLTANGTASGIRAAFQYTNDGTVNQTTWQFITANNTSRTITDTLLAMTPLHMYETFIYQQNSAGIVYWQINDLTASTTASGSVSTNTPTVVNNMQAGLGVGTTAAWTAGVRKIQFLRIYVENDN